MVTLTVTLTVTLYVQEGSLEEALFEARMAAEDAEARCVRFKLRLSHLFDASLMDVAQQRALRTGKTGAAARLRENELLATIETLQRALERKAKEAQHMIASSKFMQVRPAHHDTGGGGELPRTRLCFTRLCNSLHPEGLQCGKRAAHLRSLRC